MGAGEKLKEWHETRRLSDDALSYIDVVLIFVNDKGFTEEVRHRHNGQELAAEGVYDPDTVKVDETKMQDFEKAHFKAQRDEWLKTLEGRMTIVVKSEDLDL